MGRGAHGGHGDGHLCHDHDCEEANCAAEFSLHEQVDKPRVRALNAEGPERAAASLFRPWPTRCDLGAGRCETPEDDPELILHVPFTVDVKLKSICIVGGTEGTRCGAPDRGAPRLLPRRLPSPDLLLPALPRPATQQNTAALTARGGGSSEARADGRHRAAASPAHLKVYLNREDVDFGNAGDLPAVQQWDLVEDRRGEVEYQTKYTKFQGVASITMFFPSSFNEDRTRLHFIGFKGEATTHRREQVVQAVYEVAPVPEDHSVGGDQQFRADIM